MSDELEQKARELVDKYLSGTYKGIVVLNHDEADEMEQAIHQALRDVDAAARREHEEELGLLRTWWKLYYEWSAWQQTPDKRPDFPELRRRNQNAYAEAFEALEDYYIEHGLELMPPLPDCQPPPDTLPSPDTNLDEAGMTREARRAWAGQHG